MNKLIPGVMLCFMLLGGIIFPSVSVSANQNQAVSTSALPFADLSSTYTFYDEIMYLSSMKVITGFPDGSFRPNDTVTRAQAAIMIGRALGLDGTQRDTYFTDVGSDVTGAGYIALAAERGIINGYRDGSFKPYQAVTRGQMAMFIDRAYDLTTGDINNFTDVSQQMAAYQAILNVSTNEIAGGFPDGTYRPDQAVTRGQFSAFMSRTLRIQNAPEPEPISCGFNANEVVNIPDQNFEKVIRNELQKPEGDITAADMCRITYLYGPNKTISDITGIEYAKNIVSLDLSINKINNINALNGLTKLKYLNLFDNEISDISALNGLTNLEDLNLFKNKIIEISALSRLTNLKDLYLSSNAISDISTLGGLINLVNLSLDQNKISDISALSELKNLKRIGLGQNEISDIGALSGFNKLEELMLDHNQISDINALIGLTNLEELRLDDNEISDISLMSRLINLDTLHLSHNQISDISALSRLTNLHNLRLSVNKISNISVLSGLINLDILGLSWNEISDISSLSELKNLRELDLTKNSISDIYALGGLYKLQTLELSRNQIHDISVLSNLINLRTLRLYGNEISDISDLGGLTQLKYLVITEADFNLESQKVIDSLKANGAYIYLVDKDIIYY